MKKRLLFFGVFGLITASTFAQTTLFTENFTTTLPGWIEIDADGDQNTWGFLNFTTNPVTNALLPQSYKDSMNSQGKVAISSSYISTGALTPDNYFISPAIDLTAIPKTAGSVSLNFKVGSSQTGKAYIGDFVSVYVITNISNPSLIAVTTPIHSAEIARRGFTSLTYDISSYAGQSVYLVFRHHNSTNKGDLLLDDISVVKAKGVGLVENEIISSIYPNPANDVLNIELKEIISTVLILSVDGKIISSQSVNDLSTSIDVQNLSTGLYSYKIETKEGKILINNFYKN